MTKGSARRPFMRMSAVLAATILGVAAPRAGTLSFPRQILIDLPDDGEFSSRRLATADFNEDGYTDLVVSRAFECRVAVVLGDGAGGFGAPSFVPLGACLFPQAMATADFTGDGHQDIAFGDEDVIVLPGDGAGGFGAPLRSAVDLGAVELDMAAADLNGDGHTDLVAPNWYCCPSVDHVTVLIGDGTGHFQRLMDLPAGFEPVKVVVADLDRNGLLDIAEINVGSGDGRGLGVFLATGPAQFGPGTFYDVGQAPEGLDVAYLDSDGNLDVAVASIGPFVCEDGVCYGLGEVSVLFGMGDGTFSPRARYSAGPSSTSVAAGDLNGDLLPDLAVANLQPVPEGGVRVLPALEPGVFSDAAVQVAAAPEARGLLLRDFDNDADLDLLLLCGNDVCVFVNVPPAGTVPVVEQLSPVAGQVGHEVVLRGSHLAGADIRVMFGRAPALAPGNPGGSDQVIRVRVPNKVDPRDPDTVTVGVTVDGVPAMAPAGPLQFTYTIPQALPAITDYTTGDPARPKSVLTDQPFVLTLSGSDFLTARRTPQRCIAVGGQEQASDALVGSPTDTSVSFSFPGLSVAGDYVFLLAFSDGSGASIEAPGFVQMRPLFGYPPTIESVSLEASAGQSVQCDFTQTVEDYVCMLGVPGAQAQPGVFVGGTFTQVRLRAQVTDPDSTPTQNDVLVVGASFIDPDSQMESTLVLFDDGSANVFSFPQRGPIPEDCTDDGFGTCVCTWKYYPVVSHDAAAHDTVFSRNFAVLDRSIPSPDLLRDCITQQNRESWMDWVAGSALEFLFEAVDRSGNLAAWPVRPAATIEAGAFACTGDACGCCLLTSTNAPLDCPGLPGMPSPDYPAGICLSAF